MGIGGSDAPFGKDDGTVSLGALKRYSSDAMTDRASPLGSPDQHASVTGNPDHVPAAY